MKKAVPSEYLVRKIVEKVFIVFGFVLLVNNANATGIIVDVAYVETNILIADQKYKPSLLQSGIGWQFTDRFSITLSQATTDSDDTVLTVTADVASMSSVMLRYGSPVNSDVNVYVMAGYTELNLLMNGSTFQTDENYASNSWGFGFEERIMNDSDLRLHLDYINHYGEGELTVNSFQLGLRYVFD